MGTPDTALTYLELKGLIIAQMKIWLGHEFFFFSFYRKLLPKWCFV